MKLNQSEMSLMEIIWENEPMRSGELVSAAGEKLGWKKSTVYTVLKHLTEKGAAANENAVSDGVADAVLVNKINVGSASKISFWLGTEWGNGANVKVSVVAADGTVHDLAVVSSEAGYEQSSNGWGKVTASQWVYGTKISYDLSEYVGQEVTVVLQLDRVDTGRSTLWFVKAALE